MLYSVLYTIPIIAMKHSQQPWQKTKLSLASQLLVHNHIERLHALPVLPPATTQRARRQGQSERQALLFREEGFVPIFSTNVHDQ